MDERADAAKHRRSGVPGEAVRAAAHLPGRLGGDLAGTLRRVRGTRFLGLAAEVAFFLTMGLPPLALGVLALIGGLGPLLGEGPLTAIETVVREQIAMNLDGPARTNALGSLEQLLAGAPALVAVPLLVAVYLAARGFTGATRGLAHLYGTEEERPFWRDALVTVALTTVAALIGVLAVLGAVLAALPTGAVITVVAGSRWVVVPLLTATFLTALYRYSRGGGSWRSELPGGLLATVGTVAAVVAYVVIVRRAPTLGIGPFVGPILTATLATLSLVFTVAAVVLFGGAYNAHRVEVRERGAG